MYIAVDNKQRPPKRTLESLIEECTKPHTYGLELGKCEDKLFIVRMDANGLDQIISVRVKGHLSGFIQEESWLNWKSAEVTRIYNVSISFTEK